MLILGVIFIVFPGYQYLQALLTDLRVSPTPTQSFVFHTLTSAQQQNVTTQTMNLLKELDVTDENITQHAKIQFETHEHSQTVIALFCNISAADIASKFNQDNYLNSLKSIIAEQQGISAENLKLTLRITNDAAACSANRRRLSGNATDSDATTESTGARITVTASAQSESPTQSSVLGTQSESPTQPPVLGTGRTFRGNYSFPNDYVTLNEATCETLSTDCHLYVNTRQKGHVIQGNCTWVNDPRGCDKFNEPVNCFTCHCQCQHTPSCYKNHIIRENCNEQAMFDASNIQPKYN